MAEIGCKKPSLKKEARIANTYPFVLKSKDFEERWSTNVTGEQLRELLQQQLEPLAQQLRDVIEALADLRQELKVDEGYQPDSESEMDSACSDISEDESDLDEEELPSADEGSGKEG